MSTIGQANRVVGRRVSCASARKHEPFCPSHYSLVRGSGLEKACEKT